jgi:Flp pilus assembly protein TadG
MQRTLSISRSRRRGGVLVLSTVVLVVALAFTALVVDLSYISLTRTELQNASDAAALAGALELGEQTSASEVADAAARANALQAAVSVASENHGGDRESVYVDATRDVRCGRYRYDPDTGKFVTEWNLAPYNIVEVTARRDQQGSSVGDGPLDLFFAPLLGRKTTTTVVTSRAALAPGVGFALEASSSDTIGVLPIALDDPTWNALLAGSGPDNYTINADETVTNTPDGVREVNIYPNGTASLPPGNRGTVDIGSPNNSTADLVRQIRHGLNAFDMSFFPNNEIRFDDGPIRLNGDTGISAGIKDDLESIKGQSRAIPIFTAVSGPGNNATYTVSKFVGVRIVYVNLTGKPTSKAVIVQPSPYSGSRVVTAPTRSVTTDTIWGPPGLVH